MVEDVLLLVLAFENFAAVAGAIETVALVAVQYGGGVSLLHGAAFSVDKSVGQLLCSAHLKLVSVVGIKAGTHEEIPVFAVLVQVGSLEYLGAVGVLLNLQACHMLVCCTFLQGKSVLVQLNAVYAPDGTEEEPHFARLGVGNHFRVDGVVDASLFAACHNAHIAELTGSNLLQHTDITVLCTIVK